MSKFQKLIFSIKDVFNAKCGCELKSKLGYDRISKSLFLLQNIGFIFMFTKTFTISKGSIYLIMIQRISINKRKHIRSISWKQEILKYTLTNSNFCKKANEQDIHIKKWKICLWSVYENNSVLSNSL